MRTCFYVGALLIASCLMTPAVSAQILGGQNPDVGMIPSNAFAASTLYPKELAENPKLEMIPREIITAWGQQEYGFDPMLLEQATFILKTPESLGGEPPVWAAILRFHEAQALSDYLLDRMTEKKLGGKTLYSSDGYGPSFLIYDDITMLVGEEEYFEDVLNADKTGGISRLMANSKLKGQSVGFLDMEPVRGMLNDQIAEMGEMMLPPPLERMKKIPDLLDSIEMSLNMDDGMMMNLIMNAGSSDDAEELNEILVNGLAMGKQMLLGQMAGALDPGDPIQEATIQYANRMADSYQAKLTPAVQGDQLSIQLKDEVAIAPVLIGMLLPAVQSTRSAARRVDGANRLRQLTLAMHNYESVHQKFPPSASVDANGKPLLSWRVHILPYIEENALYEQFHLDEPWDSPHNRELVDKMPNLYMSPDIGDLNGKTVYLGPQGKGFAMSDKPLNFRSIHDGASNTVLLIEADASEAQIWTKPGDYKVDPNDPLRGLGGTRPAGFNVSLCDGSVQLISNGISEETWLALLTIGGGEVVSRDDF